jgi:Tfp pilus assembly protein PilW
MRATVRGRLRNSDEGTSLIELLVVMIVFTMILAIITSAIITMQRQTQTETGQANNLDASRKVIELLDRSVRYANGITAPGIGTDGSLYVEWETGNAGQQQTCTQWRWVSVGGAMQWRTWKVGINTPTSWATAAIGMSQVGATPIFSIAASNAATTKEELAVLFTATSGPRPASSVSEVTLTAINSATSSPPTTAICTGVGRP